MPNMPKIISKMPALIRKVAVKKRFNSFLNMDKETRIVHVAKMLKYCAELNEKEAKNIFSTRKAVVDEIKQRDEGKGMLITNAFQEAFSRLSNNTQETLRKSMSKFAGNDLSVGYEWTEFDS